MTREAQRIAIAEACGYESAYSWMGDAQLPAIKGGGIWTVGDKELYYETLPDYLTDLNAAAEFAKYLVAGGWSVSLHTNTDSGRYWVCVIANDGAKSFVSSNENPARAICESGLRALNLWKEDSHE